MKFTDFLAVIPTFRTYSIISKKEEFPNNGFEDFQNYRE
jgi:hypothetical protein